MRILFLGDVVGRSGREAVERELPGLRQRHRPDFVILNGENAAGGFGITEAIFHQFLGLGVDAVTTGNHVWDQREALVFIERQERLLRPVNFPQGTPGRGSGVFEAANGGRVLVVNAMGRVFMGDLDCPFRAVDAALDACPLGKGADAVVIDMHAEATSEKQALAHRVDGHASLVVGTHTHVPTADDQILDGGTAFMSDVGMCGDYDSVLGMNKEESMTRFLTRIPTGRFEPARGEATVSGVLVDTDDETGLAVSIEPIRIGGRLRPVEPEGRKP